MADHLPECQRWFTDMPAPDECPACEMFRACEARVREEVNAEWWGKSPYQQGLSAARDAVAASGGHSDRCICDECYGTAAALAAIDALSE